MAKMTRKDARIRRHARVRKHLAGIAARPRLAVFRSNADIYAQIIDDQAGLTLTAASSIDHELRSKLTGKSKTEQASMVGEAIALRAKEKGINQVVFDRGGFMYIGRVKALAEAARKAGLDF
jgi:large subunit ribosomal protein L18